MNAAWLVDVVTVVAWAEPTAIIAATVAAVAIAYDLIDILTCPRLEIGRENSLPNHMQRLCQIKKSYSDQLTKILSNLRRTSSVKNLDATRILTGREIGAIGQSGRHARAQPSAPI